MAGQTPRQKRETEDLTVILSKTSQAAPSSTIIPLGVALEDMWLEHVSVRYSTAQGGAATAKLEQAASGTAPGSGTALTSATAFDMNTTTNAVQTAEGVATSNYVPAGATISLVASTSLTTAAGIVITAQFTTRRH